jgi:hypothetical protein
MEITADKNSVESIIKKAEEYGSIQGNLIKYKAIYKVSGAASELLSYAVIAALFIPFFALLNLGICIWLGDKINNMPGAFFIMSGFYLIVALVLAFTRKKWIRSALENSIINHSLK